MRRYLISAGLLILTVSFTACGGFGNHAQMTALYPVAPAGVETIVALGEDIPEEAVSLPYGYPAAFEHILKALREEGYRLAIADPPSGFIETYPKAIDLKSEDSNLQYDGVYRIQLDGDRNHSWAVIEYIVIPRLAGEREKLIEKLLRGEAAIF